LVAFVAFIAFVEFVAFVALGIVGLNEGIHVKIRLVDIVVNVYSGAKEE